MSPILTQIDHKDARSRDFESFCDFFLGNAFQKKFFDFSYVFFSQLCSVMGFAFDCWMGFIQTRSKSMLDVFSHRAPFKILNRIVLFVSVYVINEGFVFWIGDEGLSDNSVDEANIALVFERKGHKEVFASSVGYSYFKGFICRIAVPASNSFDSSKIGNFVVGKLFDCFPNFGRMSLHAFSPLQKVFAKARSRFTDLTSFFILPRLQLRSE